MIVAVVMVALNGGLFDSAVHPFDLAVGPRVVGFRQPVLDPVGLADHVEAHRPGIDCVAVPGLLSELDAVFREDGVDVIGHRLEHVLEELPRRLPVGFFDGLGDRKFAGSVDAYEQVELALGGLHLRDIDVEETDWVALELLPVRFLPLDVRQAGNAMALQVPVQGPTASDAGSWAGGHKDSRPAAEACAI